MTFAVNDGGVWRTVKTIQVNDNGTWRTTINVEMKAGGTWRSMGMLNTALTMGESLGGLNKGYGGPNVASPFGSASPSTTDINGYSFDLYFDTNSPTRIVFHLYAPQDTYTATSYAATLLQVNLGASLNFADYTFFSSGSTFTTWTWNGLDVFNLTHGGETAQFQIFGAGS